MSLLGEEAAHPNAPLEMTREAFPFLLPHGREMAEGEKSPRAGVRERERQRGRGAAQCGEEREITGTTRRKRKVGL